MVGSLGFALPSSRHAALNPQKLLSTLRWVVGLLATAVCYGVVGWVSLQFAIPTHYASPLFPAAGLALACVLTYGPRAALGVGLGSAALNWVLISIGLALPEGLTVAELAWSDVLRTRPRRARLHLAPTHYMRVQWLSDRDVLTGAGAIAELETLAAARV